MLIFSPQKAAKFNKSISEFWAKAVKIDSAGYYGNRSWDWNLNNIFFIFEW